MTTRCQLSLFLSGPDAAGIEAIRQLVDPVQASLIPAHVTLVREHELVDLAAVERRLAELRSHRIELTFGAAERFGGHGLLLPCIDGLEDYRSLRRVLLGPGPIDEPQPHLTLAHPRNPQALGNSLAVARGLPSPLRRTFAAVHVIRQCGRDPWEILREHALGV